MTDRVIKKEENMSDIENQLDEALGAQGSLKPNSAPVADPKSRAETMASIVGMALAVPADQLNSYWKECLNQYQKLRGEGPGDAGSNQSTQNMKPSGAEGSAGAGVKMPPTKLPGATIANVTKEDVQSLFDGESLTEESQEKFATLFEAAVNLRVGLIEAELQDNYDSDLQEAVESFITETKKGLDSYIEYSVNQWIEENEVAIVDSLRLENTEDFMTKLRDLFIESYIDVPEERLDVVREMAERLAEMEDAMDEAVNTIHQQSQKIAESEKAQTFDDVTEGMTLVDKEKFKTLIESVDYGQGYKEKLATIKEHYFTKKTPANSGDVNVLNENTDGFVETRQVYRDPLVEAAARVLKRGG